MSHSTNKRSSAATWVTAVLLALVLYVGTWPVVEIKLSQWLTKSTVLPDGTFVVDLASSPDRYLNVFYKPLRVIRGEPEFIINPPGAKAFYNDNVLARYWLWWMDILE